MAVDAVAFVVLEKLRDLLFEESYMKKQKQQVIRDQLLEMQNALEKMSGFFMDAASKETNVDQIKKWFNDYLRHLYYVEDSIESFALRITCQRKTYGFLMNHALFLRKFTACKMLSRKLKKTQLKIKMLNGSKPEGVEDASLRGKHPLTIEYSFRPVFEVDEEGDVGGGEEEDDDVDGEDGKGVEEEEEEKEESSSSEPILMRSNSTPTASNKEGDQIRLFSEYSFKILRRSHASIMRERFQQAKLTHSYSYNEEEQSIIGYKHKVAKLRNRLDNEDDRVISVVGEPGSGKTMLARAIFGNKNIKSRYELASAWVTIFKESKTKDILLNLLKQVQKSKGEEHGRMSEDPPERRLSDQLKNKRYLIVLDGIQSRDQWESLTGAFPDAKNGSKIIVTTCKKKVAMLADSKMNPHVMGKLRLEESWTLFLRKVGLQEDEEEVHQVSVGERERIVEVCRGLPLNIVLLGSLLSTKDRETWTETLEKQEIWQTSDIVMLSYNDLDPHLKLCLLYMMMFPKESDIPVRRLQRLWLAEGFVKRVEYKFQEDVVQEYFENLVKRSLIMVTKLRSDGSNRKCRLLGVLRDHLLANVGDISLFHVHGGSADCNNGQSGKRRLIEFADGNNCSFSSSEYRRLRSYISFNHQKKDIPAKYVGNLVKNMIGKGYGLLRVLDLEGVYKPSLPENLGDLFHLRYLGLRWTFLDKLPKSVGELPYLETLDLKHTFINKIPPSIWKLKHLRHLNLNEIHLDKDTRLQTRNSLPQLLTLWGLSVNQDSPVKNGLSRFTELRELGISLRFSKDDTLSTQAHDHDQVTQDLVLDWISKLTGLRQLRLRSKDESGNPAHLSLKPFSGLNQLSHMKLLGKLQNLPTLDQFPPRIKVLTLSVSHLTEDPMPVLGQLQELTVLRLLANSYLGEEIFCPPDTFKNLLVLKLWMLNKLKKWRVGEGAMEKLKELNIRCCSNLENIPSRLLQQKTFQDLILNDMPDEFKDNAVKVNNNFNQRKFSISIWPDPESSLSDRW